MNRVYVQHAMASHILEVFILQDRPDGTWIQQPRPGERPEWVFLGKEADAYPVIIKPSFCFHYEDARALVDALTGAGFMPGEVGQIKGELTATKKHLEDMRHIVFSEPREKIFMAGAPQTEFEFPVPPRKT